MKKRIDSEEQRRQNMNLDKADNNWQEFRRQVEERWQALSPEQVSGIAGRRDKLAKALQETYGFSAHEADTEIKRFEAGQVAGSMAGSGRGPTERSREFASGNQTGDSSPPRGRRH